MVLACPKHSCPSAVCVSSKWQAILWSCDGLIMGLVFWSPVRSAFLIIWSKKLQCQLCQMRWEKWHCLIPALSEIFEIFGWITPSFARLGSLFHADNHVWQKLLKEFWLTFRLDIHMRLPILQKVSWMSFRCILPSFLFLFCQPARRPPNTKQVVRQCGIHHNLQIWKEMSTQID